MQTEYNGTKIYRRDMKKIVKNTLSSQDIVEFLENGMVYRTFVEVIDSVCEMEDKEKELITCLEAATGKKRKTVRENVKNWMGEVCQPSREEIYQICFAMHLNLQKTNSLLLSSTETGIHYRNARELIYIFGLEHQKSWKEIVKIRDRILKLCREKVYLPTSTSLSRKIKYTDLIQAEYENKVKTEEDLEKFVVAQYPNLGNIHQSAYHDFMAMLTLLQDASDGERKMSVTEIVTEYIDMGVPTTRYKNKRNYSYIQKIIQKNWPSKDKIYKMRNGDLDISRKVMILLFLITEEFMDGSNLRKQPVENVNYEETEKKYEDYFGQSRVWDEDEIFEIRVNYMNMYLDLYGMNQLDPRNPFDCLVLYALKASYEAEEEMSQRMRSVLSKLFEQE